MATKVSYEDSPEKRAVREFLFSFFVLKQFNKIIGLAGPDIKAYLQYCKSKGFNHFEIFESDMGVLMKQMREVDSTVALRYGNILSADADRDDVLYDLDYCSTVRYMKEHIKKFNKNFIMTFSRRIKDIETISTFFKAKGEEIVSVVTKFSPREYKVYHTDKGNEYIYLNYKDTSCMCCIAKIN